MRSGNAAPRSGLLRCGGLPSAAGSLVRVRGEREEEREGEREEEREGEREREREGERA